LRELLDQATPGPWAVAEQSSGWSYWVLKGVDGTKRQDAELAALAPVLGQLVLDIADALCLGERCPGCDRLHGADHESGCPVAALLARVDAIGKDTPA
jgi:hypothetical protein